MVKTKMFVDRMECQSCANAVFYLIKKAGGTNIKISLDDKTAEFSTDGKPKPTDVQNAVNRVGYQAKIVK